MHFKFMPMLGILAVLPAFGAARLPAVNIDGDSVSARSAFGDNEYSRGNVTSTRRVVSRAATKKTPGITYNAKKNGVDVLLPNLPSSNLWAENHSVNATPLRMPRADEIAILDTNYDLPDEELDINYTADARTPVSRSEVAAELENTMNRMAEIDAQIAKLSELQNRANNKPKATKRVNDGLADLSPTELRKAFRKTFLSENKHLSAMRDASADEYDVRESFSTAAAGFTAESNLSEMDSGIRPFEIKVSFRNFDSALSRENYTLLTTFAGIVVNDPKRAVQVLIPNDATTDADNRKLTARRLAIVEQVLRDTGVPEQRILPVLSNREDDGGLVLRNIDNTQYETLTRQQRNKFGKTTNKTYKSMSW